MKTRNRYSKVRYNTVSANRYSKVSRLDNAVSVMRGLDDRKQVTAMAPRRRASGFKSVGMLIDAAYEIGQDYEGDNDRAAGKLIESAVSMIQDVASLIETIEEALSIDDVDEFSALARKCDKASVVAGQ